MRYLINRLREPSTRNGLAVALTIAAQYLPMHAPWLLMLAGMFIGFSVVIVIAYAWGMA